MTLMSVVDTETTGLDPNRHRVIEVSLARVEDNNWADFTIETFRFRPSIEDYAAGEPRAYEVNGYRPRHPDWEEAPECGSPEAAEQWGKIAALLENAPLVGYNTRFDASHIWGELHRHQVPRVGSSTPYDGEDIKGAPWRGHAWDVGDFARALMKQAGRKGWKLSVVYEELCKGPALPPHRAEADVLRTLWVMAEGKKAFPHLWPDISVDGARVREVVESWCEMRLALRRGTE